MPIDYCHVCQSHILCTKKLTERQFTSNTARFAQPRMAHGGTQMKFLLISLTKILAELAGKIMQLSKDDAVRRRPSFMVQKVC